MSVRGMLDRWIFERFDVPRESLGVFRMVYAAALLLTLPRWLHVGALPSDFFAPPIGLTRLIAGGFPPVWHFMALNVVLCAALMALLVGYRTGVSSLIVALAMFWGSAWKFSTGKIDHGVLLLLVPLVLAASDWGQALSYDAARRPRPPRRDRAWPVALLALLIGFALFEAGMSKALTGWLDPDTHAVRNHLVKNYMYQERPTWFADLALAYQPAVLWEAMDWMTLALECGFIVALFWLTGMRIACAIATVFHLGVGLLMNILFYFNVIAYGVFVDWRRIVPERWRSGLGRAFGAAKPWHLAVATAVWVGVALPTGRNPVTLALAPLTDRPDLVIEWVAVVAAFVIGAGYLAVKLSSVVAARGRARS